MRCIVISRVFEHRPAWFALVMLQAQEIARPHWIRLPSKLPDYDGSIDSTLECICLSCAYALGDSGTFMHEGTAQQVMQGVLRKVCRALRRLA